jgi:hypothetical protein
VRCLSTRRNCKLRAQALYGLDSDRQLRCSHHNPDIRRIYEEYLGAPNSHRAHELLHTYYYPRVPLGSGRRRRRCNAVPARGAGHAAVVAGALMR